MILASPFLEAHEVGKRFPGVHALDRVSLQVTAGEVMAVVGENGAGKSTLMKILAGIYPPDEGRLRIDGRETRFPSVATALNRGIILIHQELNLAENLSVAANIFLGRESTWGGPLGFFSRRRQATAALPTMRRVGLKVSPHAVVGSLSLGHRQLVEIARALSLKARLIIMDEPTSSLTAHESERLFEVVESLRREGVAVLYISHRLAEVQRLADRVIVLRDGRLAGELQRNEISHDSMVRLMVGRELKRFYARDARPPILSGQPRLEIQNLRFEGGPAVPASFHVNGGEIVGVAGLIGAGRTELFEAVFGIRGIVAGEVIIDGERALIRKPADAVALGVLLIPEDRRGHGLVLDESVRDNVALPNWDRLNRLGIVDATAEKTLAQTTCDRLRVRTPSIGQPVGLLSGGNQQKVVLGKWLARAPRVLIFDEPTRGIDVGAKSEIYALMDEQAKAGVAVVMISSDLEEILGMSDRVIVMHEGRIAGELSRAALSEEAIMRLATGGTSPV